MVKLYTYSEPYESTAAGAAYVYENGATGLVLLKENSSNVLLINQQ